MRLQLPARRPARSGVGLLVCAALLIGSTARAGVRPISEAERAAVQIAADYLSRGPQAVAERLAASSPLKTLPAAAALAEIETRLGPNSGATWELQTVVPALKDKTAVFSIEFPSGVDDSAIFDLVNENGAYRIRDIRVLALPSANRPVFAKQAETAPQREKRAPVALLLSIGIVAALLAGGSAFVMRENRPAARWMTVSAALLIASGVALAWFRDARFRPAEKAAAASVAVAKEHYDTIATLLPLRRAMAGGADVKSALPVIPREGTAHDVAAVWRAQVDLQQMNTAAVKSALSKFESPSDIPQVEILRARLALAEGDEVTPAVSLEHAVNLGPGRDGLWLESAQTLLGLGYEDRAVTYLDRLSKIGSRKADVYYTLAALHAWKKNEDQSEKDLQQAWSMRPAKRSELIDAAILWSVLRRKSLVDTISLSAPAEASFTAADARTRSIALPPDAQARVCGDWFDVRIGEQELVVPGGASLAPVDAPVVDAAAWDDTDEARTLRELPQLMSMNRAAAVTQPVLRRRITRAATALANHNRWSDLVALTDGLTAASDQVPAEVLLMRSTALQRLSRTPEAKQVVADLAVSKTLQRRRDARALMQVGESLADFDLYDPAVRMYDKAQTIHQNPMIDDRVRQIQMNKRLATSYSTYATEHFEIHFPSDVSQASAMGMGTILEAEFKRLQAWVPTPNFKKLVVNVVWWNEFRSTYTGNDFILGFFKGKITLPFAGVPYQIPQLVAILSHELCHALIADATNDQAPRWFHEGLAQRIEMRPYHANAFNMYEDNRLLALSLLDSTMAGSPDPDMIGQAYIQAQTTIRYIEAAYGRPGIAKLLQAFRNGATTEDAIAQLSGGNVAAFDTKLRAWGRSGTNVFENPEPVRYDNVSNDEIKWTNGKSGGQP